jgi:predicted  nucleic acid-binding Zn-ribbon protein
MISSLAALIALQSIDSAAEASRRRLAELPEAERQIDEVAAAAAASVEAGKARIDENHAARRALERDVAAVDTRLARFEDHKAAVKTNQEYTALLHEIATAKAEKDSLEERILLIMEDGDRLAAELKTADAALSAAKRDGEAARSRLTAERAALDAELARLDEQRAAQRSTNEPRALAVYDQLIKMRRGIAVARLAGEICAACHVRLRPHIVQMVRRNDSLVQCESCQRILYWEPPSPQPAADAAGRA